VDEAVVAPLEADPTGLLVLVILTVTGPLDTATANLLAPLVVAPSSRRGMQIVLADDTLPLDAPLRS
jgi:flagellar assembly factor FliW